MQKVSVLRSYVLYCTIGPTVGNALPAAIRKDENDITKDWVYSSVGISFSGVNGYECEV